MQRILGSYLAVAALALGGACASEYTPPPSGADDGSDGSDDGSDGSDGSGDDGPSGSADAAPPASAPDAAPEPLAYPSGPYGTKQGDVIANLAWTGFMDTPVDDDSDHFNEAAHAVSLEDFFVGRDPQARLLMINASAGWCSACQQEAGMMPEIDAKWRARGVRMVTMLFEDEAGNTPSAAFAEDWGTYFDLTTPVLLDPQDLLGAYYIENAVPFNLFVDLETMTIVAKFHGFDHDSAEEIFETYASP